MKEALYIMMLVVPFIGFCQPVQKISNGTVKYGIQFESGLSWKAILAKAKEENKYIFIDCYATWCGPCKYMSREIFTQKKVADYFNEHFINVAVQMDRTLTDSKEVQAWYQDADSINKTYGIGKFPTYIIFSAEGVALHRIVGASNDGNQFLARVLDGFIPEKQYYRLINDYKGHLGDSLFLRDLLTKVISFNDGEVISSIASAYLDCLKCPFLKNNIELIAESVRSTGDRSFQFLLSNLSAADEALRGKGRIGQVLSGIVSKEKVDAYFAVDSSAINYLGLMDSLKSKYPSLGDVLLRESEQRFKYDLINAEIKPFFKKDAGVANWEDISKTIKGKYIGFDAGRILADWKARYYYHKGEWDKFKSAILGFMGQYGEKLDIAELNSNAWAVFLRCGDRPLLLEALKWSRKTIEGYPKIYPGYLDTYANLLYKTGEMEMAVFIEKVAIESAADKPYYKNDIKDFVNSLNKMQNGDKTWEDDTAIPKN